MRGVIFFTVFVVLYAYFIGRGIRLFLRSYLRRDAIGHGE
jgi:hypothetical protein